MTNIESIADYILKEQEYVSTMKLQKLTYYCKAYHYHQYDMQMFPEKYQAWINGPVSKKLFDIHKGYFIVGSNDLDFNGQNKLLCKLDKLTVDIVLKRLGHYSAKQLSDLTHQEDPWALTRGELPPDAKCEKIIDESLMRDYYNRSNLSNPLFDSCA